MVLVGLLLAGSVTAQTIYRCEIDGELVFSQQPCSEDAEVIEHDFAVPETDAPASEAVSNPLARPAHDVNYVERVRIERRIDRHERKIRNLQDARAREIAIIRQKRRRAMNNLAGATWEQSMATDMQSVTDRYESEIDIEQRAIDRLRDDLDRLRD
jgi:hypothetical protein